MPSSVNWKDSEMEIDANFTAGSISASYITDLRKYLTEFRIASGATTLLLDRVGAGPLYDYEFSDGSRTWAQSIDSTDSSDPGMTFDVADYWQVSEFAPGRPLRDWFVAGIRDYGLKKCEVVFL